MSGHIDGTGVIEKLRREENAVWVTIRTKPAVLRLIVEKGSVGIDGISLTVASVSETGFPIQARRRRFLRRRRVIWSIWRMIL